MQYLHRTIKDYLRRADIWRHIISGAEPFNPDLILAGTFLHSVKVMTLPPGTFESFLEYPRRTFRKFWEYFNLCVHHSLSLESTDTQLKFIDELKQTGDTLFAWKNSGDLHWAASSEDFGRGWHKELFYYSSFFGLAIRYRLHSYVQRELVGDQLNSFIGDKGLSVLYDAAIYDDIIMLKILFDAGGDPNGPNFDNPHDTPWVSVLTRIRVLREAWDKLDYWAQVVGLFLDHGADPYAYAGNSKIVITDLIEEKFGEWEPIKTRELLEKVEAAKKIFKKSNRKRKLGALWCFG